MATGVEPQSNLLRLTDDRSPVRACDVPFPWEFQPYVPPSTTTTLTTWPPPLSDADVDRIADAVVAKLRTMLRTLTVWGRAVEVPPDIHPLGCPCGQCLGKR